MSWLARVVETIASRIYARFARAAIDQWGLTTYLNSSVGMDLLLINHISTSRGTGSFNDFKDGCKKNRTCRGQHILKTAQWQENIGSRVPKKDARRAQSIQGLCDASHMEADSDVVSRNALRARSMQSPCDASHMAEAFDVVRRIANLVRPIGSPCDAKPMAVVTDVRNQNVRRALKIESPCDAKPITMVTDVGNRNALQALPI